MPWIRIIFASSSPRRASRRSLGEGTNLAMNPNNEPGTSPGALPRRGFLTSAAGAAVLPIAVNAADEEPAPGKEARKKTFLAVEGHLDDAEIGAGGVLIQAARAGHRV